MSGGHFDVVVIGSGAGGGTVAQRLAPTGKKILILERGEHLPRDWASACVRWRAIGRG
jgi:choline dehydrogenase-like flavoprotein